MVVCDYRLLAGIDFTEVVACAGLRRRTEDWQRFGFAPRKNEAWRASYEF